VVSGAEAERPGDLVDEGSVVGHNNTSGQSVPEMLVGRRGEPLSEPLS
jgi:hypothetical protein